MGELGGEGVKGEQQNNNCEAIHGLLKVEQLEYCTVPELLVASPHSVFVIFTPGTKNIPTAESPNHPRKSSHTSRK